MILREDAHKKVKFFSGRTTKVRDPSKAQKSPFLSFFIISNKIGIFQMSMNHSNINIFERCLDLPSNNKILKRGLKWS